MLKNILFFGLIVLALNAKSQSSLIFVNDSISAAYGTFYAEHQGYFHNESGINDTLVTQYELVSSPSDWYFSFCVGLICLTPNSDYFESTLNSADSILIKGVWNAGSSGVGVVKFTSYLKNDTDTTYSYLYLSIGSLGLSSLEQESEVSLFPNPAQEEFNITANDVITSVFLLDALGKKHTLNALIQDNQCKINLSNIESGTYSVQVITQKGTSTSKLIVL